jgi:hypothetical protein
MFVITQECKAANHKGVHIALPPTQPHIQHRHHDCEKCTFAFNCAGQLKKGLSTLKLAFTVGSMESNFLGVLQALDASRRIHADFTLRFFPKLSFRTPHSPLWYGIVQVLPKLRIKMIKRALLLEDNQLNIYQADAFASLINPLTPIDHYSGRTASLTSKRCILYIYSTNIGTEYFKHGIYSPCFSL